jgi:hypothetical protein
MTGGRRFKCAAGAHRQVIHGKLQGDFQSHRPLRRVSLKLGFSTAHHRVRSHLEEAGSRFTACTSLPRNLKRPDSRGVTAVQQCNAESGLTMMSHRWGPDVTAVRDFDPRSSADRGLDQRVIALGGSDVERLRGRGDEACGRNRLGTDVGGHAVRRRVRRPV